MGKRNGGPAVAARSLEMRRIAASAFHPLRIFAGAAMLPL